MNKFILLSVIFAVALTAAVDPPTCDATNGGFDNAGQCQLCHILCKTCSAAGDASKCKTCHTGFSIAGGAAEGACTCTSNTTFLRFTNGVPACGAKDQTFHLSTLCPFPGFGAVAASDGGTTDAYCKACASGQSSCLCSDKAAKDVAATKCTGCAGGGTLASDACTVTSDNPKYIAGRGYYKACPDGYVDKSGTCTPCGPGCKTCDATTVTTCKTCPANYGLDASNVCKKCATGETVNATTNKCEVALPWGCKTADTADATKCAKDGCDATKNFMFDETTKLCVCTKQTWKKKTSAAGVTPEVHECAACTKTCAAPNECKADGSDCEVKTVTVACDNAALKDSGCNTCAKDATDATLFVCSACATGTKLGDATKDKTKACVCSGGATKEAWDKTNKKCVACASECTGTTPSCNLGTDGKATCGATPPPPTTGSDDTTNSILISAISMLLAVILF